MADASLGTVTLHTKLDASGLTTGLRKAEQDTTTAARKMSDQLAGIGARMQKIGAGLTIGLTTPLTALGVAGVRSAMQLETFSASLKVLIGDANRAEAAFNDLYEFSANAPFSWESLTEGTRILAAFGTEAEDLVPTLSMLGDVAAGVQTPIEDLTEAYGRMQLTGRVGTLDLQRLASRGIPIYTELARVLNVSEGKVQELVTAGKVGFPQIETAFKNMTTEGGKFYGMMDAQADTTAGRLNRLKDSFSQVTDVIGDRLLPTFDRLIAAGQSATDWFVNLDEGWQDLLVTAGGLAAAVGPLTVGLGTIVKLLPLLSAGLAALTGPAGLIVLGVAAVAGLALVMAGPGSDAAPSLEKAIGKVSVAASNTSALEGLDTTLTTLATNLTGGVKRAFQGARDDILAIVGAAEDARAKLAAISLGVELAQQAQNNAMLKGTIASAFTIGAAAQPAQLLQDALFSGDFKAAIAEVEDLIRRYSDIGSQMDIDVLKPFLEQLRGAEAALDKLLNPASTPNRNRGGAGDGNSGNLPGVVKRTWQDVLNDLDKSGTEAMRRAAFEGTDEAFRAAATKRVSLIDDAITEALTTYYGQVSTGELEALRARRAAAEREASARTLTAPDVQATFNLDNSAAERALLASVDARQRSTVVAVRASVGRTFDGIADGVTAFGETLNAAKDAYYTARFGDSADEMQRFATTTAGLTATIKAANDETARMEVFAAAAAKYGAGRAGLAGTSAAERGGVFTGVDRDAAAAVARETVETVVQAFKDGSGSIDDVRTAVDTLTTLTPLSVSAINELTDGILKLERVALDAARAAEQNERAPMWVPPGGLPPVPTAGLPTSTYQGFRPRESIQADLDAAARINKQREESADRFSQTVVSAGFDFGNAAIKAFQDGDIVGVLRAGLGGAGSIVGGMDLGGLSFLGGTIGIGSLIAGGLGLLGTLIGALAGGGDKTELESRRAAGVTPRGAPAIDLSIIINQSLNIQSLTDTASRRAVDGLLDDMVRRVEDTLKRNVLPRLDKLEGATA